MGTGLNGSLLVLVFEYFLNWLDGVRVPETECRQGMGIQSEDFVCHREATAGHLSWRCETRGNRIDTASSLGDGENKPSRRGYSYTSINIVEIRIGRLMCACCLCTVRG